MRVIPVNELQSMKVTTISAEKLEELIANYIYRVLQCNISLDELHMVPEMIQKCVKSVINCDYNARFYLISSLALEKLLIDIAIDSHDSFSLEDFIRRPDFFKPFLLDCNYNRVTAKSALGYILPDKAIYCNAPTNHAAIVTAYNRRSDPNFEDLNLYHSLHPEQPNESKWQDYIMFKQKAIIIHFMPVSWGTPIFIPDELTEFQYKELERINKVFLNHNATASTNYREMDLDTALKDEAFKLEHGCGEKKI